MATKTSGRRPGTKSTFAQRAHWAKAQTDHTGESLAQEIGCSYSSVRNWLYNGRVPTPDHLLKLCRALGVGSVWMQTGRGRP